MFYLNYGNSFYFEFTGFVNKKCVNYTKEKIGFIHLIMICKLCNQTDKYWNWINFLDENLGLKLDSLQSEPKRIRKSQNSYPCCLCEYYATITRNLKRHVGKKHERVR